MSDTKQNNPVVDATTPKEKMIRVADGHIGGMIQVATTGNAAQIGVFLTPGQNYKVVPDDSIEDGFSETLAASLIERGLCQQID